MMDLTDVIGPLSLAFQANELLVIDVIPKVEATMLKLIEMKHSPGECISTIVHGFEHEGIFLRGPVEPELKQLHKKNYRQCHRSNRLEIQSTSTITTI